MLYGAEQCQQVYSKYVASSTFSALQDGKATNIQFRLPGQQLAQYSAVLYKDRYSAPFALQTAHSLLTQRQELPYIKAF